MDIVLIFKTFKNKISLPLGIGESREQAIDPKAGVMVAEASERKSGHHHLKREKGESLVLRNLETKLYTSH